MVGQGVTGKKGRTDQEKDRGDWMSGVDGRGVGKVDIWEECPG